MGDKKIKKAVDLEIFLFLLFFILFFTFIYMIF